jgi:hypothetical protein
MRILPLLCITLLILPKISNGQVEAALPVSTAKTGALTATAYDWEAIGVNPSNLGWPVNHKFSFTILGIGASAQSEGNNFPSFLNFVGASNPIATASSQQILGAPKGMNIEADIEWFAVSFRIPKIPGAFAINMRDRIFGDGFTGPGTPLAVGNGVNQTISDQAMLDDLGGTSLVYNHYREINLDYGFPLFKLGGGSAKDIQKCFSFSSTKEETGDNGEIYGGIGIKYLIGYANINADVAGGRDSNGSESNGINALYSINNSYPDIPPPKGLFSGPGHGYAFDLGLSAIYKRWTFGLSATDLGSITWKQGYVTAHDTNIDQIRHGSTFWDELTTGTLAGSIPAPSYSTTLPEKLRAGAAFKVTPSFLVSGDFIYDLNQSPMGIDAMYFALGGQIALSNHVKLFTGVDYAIGYNWAIPLGISIGFGKHMSFYLGTNDITGLVGKTSDANVSAAVGVFRYNW